jgi:hypothetical protein
MGALVGEEVEFAVADAGQEGFPFGAGVNDDFGVGVVAVAYGDALGAVVQGAGLYAAAAIVGAVGADVPGDLGSLSGPSVCRAFDMFTAISLRSLRSARPNLLA